MAKKKTSPATRAAQIRALDNILSVWRPKAITDQPKVTLRHWKIIEVSIAGMDKSRHFLGFDVAEGEGRISSPIHEYDKKAMRGRTRTGRVYQLVGPSGSHADADHVLDMWLRLHSNPPCRVVAYKGKH